MTLFILTETSAGYALFKAKDKKLLSRDDVGTQDAAGLSNLVKLKKFEKFDSATTALEEVSALIDGKVTPKLSSLLDSIKDEKKASLAVADPKLGNAINKIPQLSITPISDSSTHDVYRSIRDHLPSLIPGLLPDDISAMSLGLSHSLSRHRLKFSPDKIDTMIIQAIALLDDLDKELNTYAMRVKEWYGWHFPEMAKIINDNLAYARCILEMGYRSDAKDADLSRVLPEEIETAVKAAAEVSMGTEISEDDLSITKSLADQVVELTEYRQQLSGYLTTRMQAIAPNLTTLVGELVGARLIAHAGSLVQLAKSPASTIQILGAEKALFRALKTKHDTPKYGLIYHASLVGQATGKNKGKIARLLATKAALGLRIDSLSEWGTQGEGDAVEPTDEEKTAHGNASRLKIERRLRTLEGRPLAPRGVAIGPGGQVATQANKFELKEARKYNPDADGLATHQNAVDAEDTSMTDTPAKLIQEINGGESGSDSESDSDTKMVNGTAQTDSSKDKKRKKAEKAARKADRAAKRERKAEKKAAKEEKLRAKEVKAADDGAKKRKREEGEGEEKKKKKKKHAT